MAKKNKMKVNKEPINEKTHIICILDRSGSMSSIMSDSIGGFNSFLKQQKGLPDQATITVALFDDQYELLYNNVDIKKAEELTDDVWYPRGMTALYDAIGKTINNVKTDFTKLKSNKHDKVLVCIVTDGLENSSREYNLNTIKKLIGDCEEDNWNFIYLAANQNAFNIGTSFGISGANTYTYTPTTDGITSMTANLTNASTLYRSVSTTSIDFDIISKNLINIKNT